MDVIISAKVAYITLYCIALVIARLRIEGVV